MPDRPAQQNETANLDVILAKIAWIDSALLVLVESSASIATNHGKAEISAKRRHADLVELRGKDAENIIGAIDDLRRDVVRLAKSSGRPMRTENSVAGKLPTGQSVEVKSLTVRERGDTTAEIVVDGRGLHLRADLSMDNAKNVFRAAWPRVRPWAIGVAAWATGHFHAELLRLAHAVFGGG